jgi:hypothetical protein
MRKSLTRGVACAVALVMAGAVSTATVSANAGTSAVTGTDCFVSIKKPHRVQIGVVDGVQVDSALTCTGAAKNVRLRTIIRYWQFSDEWRNGDDRTVSFGTVTGTRTGFARMNALACLYVGIATVTWTLPSGTDWSKQAITPQTNLCS